MVVTNVTIAERQIENCPGVLKVIYNFNTKNLISFQDNFNAKADLTIALFSILKQQRQQIAILILKK